MKKKITFALFLVLFAICTVSGQIVPPPIPPPPPPGLPLDGGIFFLIISAVLYGFKVVKNK